MAFDPITMASEIAEFATILQAAQAMPASGRRSAARKERQQAYLAFQRETHRLMACVSQLSVIAQMDVTSLRTAGPAVIPMIGSFVDSVLPAEPSDRKSIRALQDFAQMAATLAEAATPSAVAALAAAHAGDNQLRDRALIDIAATWNVTADFLTALTTVRLVGRSGPIAAAEPVRALLQELFSRIPAHPRRSSYSRILPGPDTKKTHRVDKFNDCISALGEASSQFMAAARADSNSRHHRWQLWQKPAGEIQSGAELLAKEQADRFAAVDTARGSEIPARKR
jgi:hypothetical protein